jgi:hypothetical protein
MNSNNKIDLMKMTSGERIKHRKDNWTKQFGNYEKFSHKVSDQDVFMEFVSEPMFSKETMSLINRDQNYDNDSSGWDFLIEDLKNLSNEEDSKDKKSNRFNWKPIHDLFDTIYSVCHRKKDEDGLFDLNYSWEDDKQCVDEYFKILCQPESLIKYIKFNIERANKIDDSLNLVFNEEKESKKNGDYKPKFLENGVQRVDKKNLIVFNLPQNITDSSMLRFFSKFGDIRKVHIMLDNRTNKPRGFGFINTYSDRTAEKIIEECDGKPMGHNILKVQVSDKNKKR